MFFYAILELKKFVSISAYVFIYLYIGFAMPTWMLHGTLFN